MRSSTKSQKSDMSGPVGNPTGRCLCLCLTDCIFNLLSLTGLVLTYPNDVLVNIHVSWLDPHKIRKMTVVGSKKMIVYDDLGKHKVAIYDKGIDRMAVLGENMDFDKNELYNFNYRSGNVIFPKINWQEPLKKEVNHFIDCILEKKKCISDIEHTKSVISILEKA